MTARAALMIAAVLASAAAAWALDPELRRLARDPEAGKRAQAATALGRVGTADAARILVELLSDRSAEARDAAVLACGGIADAEAVSILASSAKSSDELVRRNCADAIGRTKNDAALPTLEHLAAHDVSPQVRADALDAVSNFVGSAKALDVAKAVASDKDAFVRAAAVEAAGRIGGDGAAAVVKKALVDDDDGVRCVARAAFLRVARAEAAAQFVDAAQDSSWRVRAQCVDDCAAVRNAPAMESLAALVGDKVTRVSAAAHRALRRITGKDIGRDSDLWKAWWNANKAAWKPPADDAEKDAVDDPKKTTARYHGMDVASDAAAFVADLSGSMKDPFGATDARSRWSVAADELRRTLGALPSSFVTNLVFFQVESKKAFPKAQPLTKAARDRADAFIAGGSPRGDGDLLGGVLAALTEDGVDTVYVLSDGAPTVGDVVDGRRIRAVVRQRNRTRKCVIDSIGIGATKPAARAFLEGLARDSGGRAVFRVDAAK